MNDFVKANPGWCLEKMFLKIDALLKTPGPIIIAIDGNSAAGKSTLAKIISKEYECNIFHMDDFFLTPEMKTAKRLGEPGGNVDRERFEKEILKGITRSNTFCYQKYDCKTSSLCPAISVDNKKLSVVEGAYSLHPDLAHYYALKIFMAIDKDEQNKRILLRNGPKMHKKFIEEWIPMENRYFSRFNIKDSCDFIFY